MDKLRLCSLAFELGWDFCIKLACDRQFRQSKHTELRELIEWNYFYDAYGKCSDGYTAKELEARLNLACELDLWCGYKSLVRMSEAIAAQQVSFI